MRADYREHLVVVIKRVDSGWVLECETVLPRALDEVFPFFADARNLERLTPKSLRFEILTPQPIEMREGLLIDYALRVRGLRMTWRSEITLWDPPRRFVDEQRRGPYSHWIHEHSFEARGGETVARDRVQYGVPGGPLAPLLHALFVRRDLLKIFAYRTETMLKMFGEAAGA